MTGAELKSKLATMKSNDDAVETFERVTAHLIENGVKIENTKFHVGAEIIGDPVKETFPGNEAANKLVTREYRKPFVDARCQRGLMRPFESTHNCVPLLRRSSVVRSNHLSLLGFRPGHRPKVGHGTLW